MPDNLLGQTIGPMCTARWLTTGIRVMCKYTRTKRPTKGLIRLTRVVLNLYLPGWFKFKCSPHIQEGARNYFFLVELSRDLLGEDMLIAQRVLQDNSFWAHSENMVISMFTDKREEVRRKGVLRIMKARRVFDPETHPRQFIPPQVNFKVNYFSIWIDIDNVYICVGSELF